MNKESLETRLLAYADLLYRVSCGILRNPQDREDAVQSAMETAWKKAGSLRDESRLKSWLVRVMINECYGILRKKQREVPAETLPEAAESPSQDALMLKDALENLPPAQRLPLILHYFEGLSIKEVAMALRLPQGTVLSRMQRGRGKLKEILSEENDGR